MKGLLYSALGFVIGAVSTYIGIIQFAKYYKGK